MLIMLAESRSLRRNCVRQPADAGQYGIGILGLCADETPDFINLKSLTRKVAKRAALIPGRSRSGVDNQLRDRRLAGAGHPRNGANGASLTEKVEDAGAFLRGELIHTGHYA